jgi:hypothetical protein
MTTYYPISFLPPFFGTAASGYVLKAYSAETSNPISFFTDFTGGTPAATVTINAAGFPAVSGNVIIPYVAENFKLALYPNQADADANTGAIYTYDDIKIASASYAVAAFAAGSSGSAGTVDIYPATASKGKRHLTCTNNSADYTITETNAAFGQATTITLPDPVAAAASYVLTEGAQTINGVKTLGSMPLFKASNAVSAFAGGGQSSATALTSTINSITICATAGDSVKLPTATAGSLLQVSNLGAAYANVFPASGDLIDALAANAALALPVGGSLFFSCAVTGSWKSSGRNVPDAKFTTNTTTTTFAAGQLTGAPFVNYTNTQGTPGSIATRTATQMFADDPNARVGNSYLLRITNGQGTGTLTVTAGVGVTLTGTATIALNTWRDFVVTYTSATALVMQNIATGTFS